MNWVEKFKKCDSLWEFKNSAYHVQTSESGLHSDLYMNTDQIVSNVPLLESIAYEAFLPEIEKRGLTPDWIVSYPPFGLPIAYALARITNANFGYADISANICNFNIQQNQKVIVIADDVYSGGSIVKTIKIIEKMGAEVLEPILSLGNFSGTKSLADKSIWSVIEEKGNLYDENKCPMCQAGSIPVLPRPNWEKFKREIKM